MSETGKEWLGQIVNGTFELREYIGGTSDSYVFLTERDGNKTAIKLTAANPRTRDVLLARRAEAAILTHPHLIRLFESGRCRIGSADLVYVVMEYAEENLAEILPQRALTSKEAGEMLPPMLDALAYLHGRGFAHGQVKPANILASGDQVKLSSDGIGRIGEAPSASGPYDAAEIAATGCSAAADVWSVGLTLVETLTQQLPRLDASGAGEVELPGPPPEPFLSIARNCLRREPQRRWTIADISARLKAPATSPPTAVAPRPEPKRQKRPANWRHLAPAAAVIVLALIVILVAPKVLNRLQGQQTGAAPTEPAQGLTSSEPAAAQPKETTPTPSASAAAPPITPVEAAAPPKKEAAPGEVVYQAVPDVPEKARATIQGTVKVGVRVQVDPAGNVTEAILDSPGPSQYFANWAIKAAREWKFSPAEQAEGGNREWMLRFQFTQNGTKVIPARAAPTN